MAAAYRDRFPLKVSWQGAGLEQTGAAGGPVVREVERVCGRLRRPAEQAAARRNERELDRFPYGREGSASDRVGIKASPGVSLAIPLSQKNYWQTLRTTMK